MNNRTQNTIKWAIFHKTFSSIPRFMEQPNYLLGALIMENYYTFFKRAKGNENNYSAAFKTAKNLKRFLYIK